MAAGLFSFWVFADIFVEKWYLFLLLLLGNDVATRHCVVTRMDPCKSTSSFLGGKSMSHSIIYTCDTIQSLHGNTIHCNTIHCNTIQPSHRQNPVTDGLDKHFKLRLKPSQVETGVFRLTKQTTLVCNSCAKLPMIQSTP